MMRRSLTALLTLILLSGVALPAAAVDVDGPVSITARILDFVDGWIVKLGLAADSDPAVNHVSLVAKDGEVGENNEPPPVDGAGVDWDPNG